MPKIIKDVENTVKDCAAELFIALDYNDVDMKMISKKSGIAVVTLYNYYKSKKELYLSILKESWQETFNKLDVINELTIPSKEKLQKFVSTLYEDIEARNDLGKALIYSSTDELKNDKETIDLKNNLLQRIERLFKNFDKVDSLNKCSDSDIKLAECLLTSLFTILKIHPDCKKDNINFLIEFIGLSIK